MEDILLEGVLPYCRELGLCSQLMEKQCKCQLGVWSRSKTIQVPHLPFTSYVTSGKILNFLKPHFPQLFNSVIVIMTLPIS